ncbi:MAG TPA: hypothetical protein VF930_05850 [Stellaceae bacterium]
MTMSRALAQLLIRDLPQIQKLAGVDVMTFAHPDRLTRAEAEKLLDWGRSERRLRDAYASKGGAGFAQVKPFFDLIQHFLHAHPQDAAGAPAEWPAYTGPKLADNPFGVTTLEEAEARMTWAQTRPEYAAFFDGKHPEHAAYVKDATELNELIANTRASAPPAAPTTPTPGENSPTPSRDAQRRIRELMQNPAFKNRAHPDHESVMEDVRAAYAEAYPGEATAPGAPGVAPPASAAPPARPAGAAPPAQTREMRLAELKAHPAYGNRSHPEHARVIEAELVALAEPPTTPSAA